MKSWNASILPMVAPHVARPPGGGGPGSTGFDIRRTCLPDNRAATMPICLIDAITKPPILRRCRPARRRLSCAVIRVTHDRTEGRHTAHEQRAEARITYRFHPRFG